MFYSKQWRFPYLFKMAREGVKRMNNCMVLPLPFLSCTIHLGRHYNITMKISVAQAKQKLVKTNACARFRLVCVSLFSKSSLGIDRQTEAGINWSLLVMCH